MMEMQVEKRVVGIDVSKETLQVYGLFKQNKSIPNDSRSISSLANALIKDKNYLVVLEPTGGYERHLVNALRDKQIVTHIADATKVYHFGQSRGRGAKTDRLDAQLLAEYGEQIHIQGQTLPSEKTYELQTLFARVEQLKKMITQEKNRQEHGDDYKILAKELKRHLAFLEKSVQRIEKAIDEILAQDKEKTALQEEFQTVKGVGVKVARLLVARLPELGRANRGEIVRLVGVAPRVQQSGKKDGAKPPRGGRAYVRQLLFLAAMTGIRYNAVLKAYYDGLVARGKVKMVALIAVVRKLVIHLNTLAQQFYQKQEKIQIN